MQIEIKHLDGRTLASVEFNRHPTFRGLDLRGADLRAQSLITDHGGGARSGWVFCDCDLTGADMTGADLSTVNFQDCILAGCKFDGARLNWCSHHTIGAILLAAVGTDSSHLDFAQMVARRTPWDNVFASGHPSLAWGVETLRAYVQPDQKASLNPSRLSPVPIGDGSRVQRCVPALKALDLVLD